MAQRAVAQLESAQGRLKGLVLANLARVVLLGKNTLSAGDAGREMTSAFAAARVILRDQSLAARLWTLELVLLVVGGRVAAKELEGQVLVLLVLLLGKRLKPLQLHEGLRAVAPATVEHACNDNHAVDLLCRELFLVLDKSHSSLHG